MTASLVANNLYKSYTSGSLRSDIISGLSLQVFPSQLTFIIGPSGCGKSTLLALLSGLLKPDAGEVLAFGENLWSRSSKKLDAFRLQNCGFIFQGFNLFSSLSALQQVELAAEYSGMRNAKAAALEALEQVELAGKSHLRPDALSGGEKQRVAIARAIVKKPRLLFADEPTSALDSTNGAIVAGLLHRLAHEQGATVLGVTHDPRLLKHADRVIAMEDGHIVAADTQAPGSHAQARHDTHA
jgi:putative ABC transport system ATP-binding protein